MLPSAVQFAQQSAFGKHAVLDRLDGAVARRRQS